jgi:hypothetical protein
MISTSTWRFIRDDRSPSGFLSRNRASTDALSALSRWQLLVEKRSFEVTLDEDQALEAALTTTVDDLSAGNQLDFLCGELGIKRGQLRYS